jgi:hypothetical protein
MIQETHTRYRIKDTRYNIHPGSNIKNRTSSIEYPASRIDYRADPNTL